MPASGSAFAPSMSGRPGAEPMLIANVNVTWRPVGPPVVIAPHVALSGYVWPVGALAHVSVMFFVTVPPAVTPVYACAVGSVQPVGSAVSEIAPSPTATLLTV